MLPGAAMPNLLAAMYDFENPPETNALCCSWGQMPCPPRVKRSLEPRMWQPPVFVVFFRDVIYLARASPNSEQAARTHTYELLCCGTENLLGINIAGLVCLRVWCLVFSLRATSSVDGSLDDF